MVLNSKHFECLVHHIYFHIKATELKWYHVHQQHSTWVRITWYLSLISLVSVPLWEIRNVHLDCAYFTPPLTAAAYISGQARRGGAHLCLSKKESQKKSTVYQKKSQLTIRECERSGAGSVAVIFPLERRDCAPLAQYAQKIERRFIRAHFPAVVVYLNFRKCVSFIYATK